MVLHLAEAWLEVGWSEPEPPTFRSCRVTLRRSCGLRFSGGRIRPSGVQGTRTDRAPESDEAGRTPAPSGTSPRVGARGSPTLNATPVAIE